VFPPSAYYPVQPVANIDYEITCVNATFTVEEEDAVQPFTVKVW